MGHIFINIQIIALVYTTLDRLCACMRNLETWTTVQTGEF